MKRKIVGILVCMSLIVVSISALGNPVTSGFVFLNNPPVADAGGPYAGEEGLELMFDASESYDPDGDELFYRWDFDGDEIWDTDWSDEPIYFYIYGDDYDDNAFVEVTDGIDNDYASSPAVIENVDPEVDAGGPYTATEGEEVYFDFSFSDPGFLDEHIICFSADSGEGALKPPKGDLTSWYTYENFRVGEYIVDTGDMELNDLHFFAVPGEIDILTTPKNWTKKSGGGWDNCSTEDNAQPGTKLTFTIKMTANATGSFWCLVIFTLDGIKIGGSIISFELNKMIAPRISGGSAQFKFTYGDDGTYSPIFNVSDDDGGYNEDTCIITVLNSPPEIEPFGPFTVKPGELIDLAATAHDPGSDDLTFVWDFGDGTPVVTNTYYNNGESPDPDILSQFGEFPFIITDTVGHIYESKGTYSVKLTVEDDNGGISEYTTSVTVPRNKVVSKPLLNLVLMKLLEKWQFPLPRAILGH